MINDLTTMPINGFFNKKMLKQYDVRGTFDVDFNLKDIYYFALAFATHMHSKNLNGCLILRDGRISSPAIIEALSNGLTDGGINIIDGGIGPTPVSYYGAHTLNVDASIMITASHNPGPDNGLKLTLKHKPFFGEDLLKLHTLMPILVKDNEKGKISYAKNLIPDYINFISRHINDCNTKNITSSNFTIVWDCGNGACCAIINELTAALPQFKHVILYGDLDGNFPNHHPDPSVAKNLSDLQKEVVGNKAQIGIAFDGDGDRLGIVDEAGQIWPADKIGTLLALTIDKEQGPILYDVKCSNYLKESLANAGYKQQMVRTGHAFIKQQIQKYNASFACELSGHLFFNDQNNFGYDDAVYGALRVIDWCLKVQLPLSNYFTDYNKFYRFGEWRLGCASRPKDLLDNLASRLTALPELNIKTWKKHTIDGVRYETPYGWFLIRASQTEPVVSICAESANESDLHKIYNILQKIIGDVVTLPPII